MGLVLAGALLLGAYSSLGSAKAATPQSAGPQSAGQLSWAPRALADPGASATETGLTAFEAGLTAISCPSATLCVAVDGQGDVVASKAPAGGAATWTVAHVDSNTAGGHQVRLTAVSCPSVSLCVAVDNLGDVFTSTDPTGGSTAWSGAKTGAQELDSVSCASTTLCVAVGGEDAVASDNPTGGAGAWHATDVDSGPCPTNFCYGNSLGMGSTNKRSLGSISCPTVSLCVAGDDDGDIVASVDPAGGAEAWNIAYVDPDMGYFGTGFGEQGAIVSVSCPSAALCVASGEGGAVFTSEKPTGGPSAWSEKQVEDRYVPARAGHLACPSTSRCVLTIAVGEAYVMTSLGVWGAPVEIDPKQELVGISCPSEGLCVAIDRLGGVLVGLAPAPTQTTTPTTTQQVSGTHRKTSQHITFAGEPKSAQAGRSYEIRASSSSRLRVSVVSKTPSVCRVAAGPQTSTHIGVRLRTRGMCRLLAKQAGNAQFTPAEARLTFRVKTAGR